MNIKTALCREFEKDLIQRLEVMKDGFKNFRSHLNSSTYIRACYYIYTPVDSLFTKEGRISLRAVDTDAHKVMRDVLYKCIGVDDKLERDTRFFTPVSHDGKWNYVFELQIGDISCLQQPVDSHSWILNSEESANLL
jgi:hypothetical protein